MLELEHIIQIDYFTYIQAQLEQTQLGLPMILQYTKIVQILLYNYLAQQTMVVEFQNLNQVSDY